MKDIRYRNDVAIGHSSGGNRVRRMARDKRIKSYGIKKAYGIAPTPLGFTPETLGQKALTYFVRKEDVRYEKGQKAALESSGKTEIPYDSVAGSEDGLVPPKSTADKDAREHYVIESPDSTHFGTSGVNPQINELLVDLVKNQAKSKYSRYHRKGKVLQMEIKDQQIYYKEAA